MEKRKRGFGEKLSPEERLKIQQMLKCGYSRKNIARILGRTPFTIGKEVKRNGGPDLYDGERAQKTYEERRQAKKKKLSDLAKVPLTQQQIDDIEEGIKHELPFSVIRENSHVGFGRLRKYMKKNHPNYVCQRGQISKTIASRVTALEFQMEIVLDQLKAIMVQLHGK